PGAGGARVSNNFQKTADCNSRNQPSVQSNPAARSADDARSAAVAEFLLATATSLGVKVGFTDNIVVSITRGRVPYELLRQLHAEQNRQAIIDHIRRENLAQKGKFVPDAVDAEGVS